MRWRIRRWWMRMFYLHLWRCCHLTRRCRRLGRRRALEIDDELPEAHASCASITKLYDWDWPKAEDEYRRCLELDPNNVIERRRYAAYLSALGRTGEALAEVYKAQELDPMSLQIGVEVAWNLYEARKYEKAAQQAMRTIDMEPEFPATGHILGPALQQLGRCVTKPLNASRRRASAPRCTKP